MSHMVDMVVKFYKNKKLYSALQNHDWNKDKSTCKQVDCSFLHLLNILFSKDVVDDFATLGHVANRQVIDSGTAVNEDYFWVQVRSAFVEPYDDQDKMNFLDNEVFAELADINPDNSVAHNWKKLRWHSAPFGKVCIQITRLSCCNSNSLEIITPIF